MAASPPSAEEIDAEVAFVHADMHWRQSNEPSNHGEADSKKNLAAVKNVIEYLMSGKGITYSPRGKPSATVFNGRFITRNDNLKTLREEADKVISKKKEPTPGAIYDANRGWTIDTQLGIWRKAKMRALGLADWEEEPEGAPR